MNGQQSPSTLDNQLTPHLDIDFALQALSLGVWEVADDTSKLIKLDERCSKLVALASPVSINEFTQGIHPQDRDRVSQAIEAALNPGSQGLDQTFRPLGATKGQLRWIRLQGRSYFKANGELIRLAGIAQDVTQQELTKQREDIILQEAQRQQRMYQVIAANTPDLMYVFDLNYRFTYVNQALLAMWGSTWENSIGKGLLENGYEPWHAELHEREIDQVVATKQSIRGEVSFPHATLGKRVYDYVLVPVLNEQGEVEAVAGTTRDITESKQAQAIKEKNQQALAQNQAHLQLLGDTVPAMIFYLDAQQRYRSYNETFRRWFGVGATEAIGRTVQEFLGEAAYEQVLPHLSVAYGGQRERYELWSPSRMGEGRWLAITYTPHQDEEGTVIGLIAHAADITQNKQVELDLWEREDHLRTAVELAQLGTWSIDVATRGLTYSDRLIDWFGRDPAAQDYEQVIPILDETDQERIAAAVAWALNPESGGVYDEIYTIIHPSTGQKRILHARGKTVFDVSGKPVRLNGTAQDITTQQEVQIALEHQVQERTQALSLANKELAKALENLASTNEELEASIEEIAASNREYVAINEELQRAIDLLHRSNENLQRFAYVASHDLQEPLRKIQTFGDLLKAGDVDGSVDSPLYVDRIQAAANRMSTLIKDLLNYSQITAQPEIREPVLLDQVVANVLTDLELMIEETDAQISLDPLPMVIGDASQLGQLFQNLLNNALKFRRPGVSPSIRIQAQQISYENLPPTVKLAQSVQFYHQVDVIDNGIGFEEQYAKRIFDAFQRLHRKHEYVGTGIGLAICEKVVTNHGGAITASSQIGQGATFSVFLPNTWQ